MKKLLIIIFAVLIIFGNLGSDIGYGKYLRPVRIARKEIAKIDERLIEIDVLRAANSSTSERTLTLG